MAAANPFEQLIIDLLDKDNAVRDRAEKTFEQATEQPDQLLQQLCNALLESQDVSVRSICAVLFRRYAFNTLDDEKSLWRLASHETRAFCKNALLQGLVREQERTVRQKICHAVAEAGQYMHKTQEAWNELLPLMNQSCSSNDPAQLEMALTVFASWPTIFGDQLGRYIGVLKEILARALSASAPVEVRIVALRATIGFLLAINSSERAIFSDMVNPMLQVIGEALNRNDEDLAQKALTGFVDMASSAPSFVRPHMEVLVQAMVQIVNQTDLDDSTRQLALEMLVTMAERSPSAARRSPSFVASVIPTILSLMVEVDDDEQWYTTDDVQYIDYKENAAVGENALDRVVTSLRGNTVVPTAFTAIQAMLQNPDWRQRHAALFAISTMAEGARKAMETNLAHVVQAIMPFVNDPHPRVRYAFCNAVGQMATDFAPMFQEEFTPVVVPALLHLLDDAANPRVQAHAAAALVNVVEQAAREQLMPFMDAILHKLFQLLSRDARLYVLEQSVTTIATVADAAQELFERHYTHFMPILMQILQYAASRPDTRVLLGKTMECVSLIGLAVGKAVFAADARAIMDIIVRSQQEQGIDEDDQVASFILSSAARIGSILGEEFLAYLPLVLPKVLESAQIRPDIALLDPDDENPEEVYDPAQGWEHIKVQDQRICVKTSKLAEKCTAVEMLYCYARELKAGFAAYAEQVLDIVVPLMKFYFDDGTRVAAASCVAPLLHSMLLANFDRGLVLARWGQAFDTMLEVMRAEEDATMLADFLEAAVSAAEHLEHNCFTQQQLANLINVVRAQLQDCQTRIRANEAARRAEDYDADTEEELEEAEFREERLLRAFGALNNIAFKAMGEAYVPFFQGLVEDLARMLAPDRTVVERQWALCFFDDLLEFAPAASTQLHQFFLGPLVQAVVDPAPEIRQAAVYGIGIMAQSRLDAFFQVCFESLPRLIQVVNQENSRSDEEVHATENAISAIAKICEGYGDRFNTAEVIPTWLRMLPVSKDFGETKRCYQYLCSLIESNNGALFGANMSNLPHIIMVMTQGALGPVLKKEPELLARVLHLIAQMEAQLPPELRSQMWALVQPAQQQDVRTLINQQLQHQQQ